MPPVFAHGRLRLYLLKLLDEAPRHGYEVIRLLEERFQGLYAPSAGTVYPRLAKLAAEGLVSHTTEGGRKVYSLTAAGRAELADRRGELAGLEAEIRESVGELAARRRENTRGPAGDPRRETREAARRSRTAGPAGAGGTPGRPGPLGAAGHPGGSAREPREGMRKDTGTWRQTRDEPRWAREFQPSGDPARDLERLLDRFRDGIRDTARDLGVTDAAVTEARHSLAVTATRLDRLLRDTAGPGR